MTKFQTHIARKGYRPWAFMVALLLAGGAFADQVQVNGIWIPKVEIIGVENGRLHYIDPVGNDIRRPFSEIGGMRVDKFPSYARGVDLLVEGKDSQAIPLLAEVFKGARGSADWLANDAGMRLAAAHDRTGNGQDAAAVYLELASRGADPAYLIMPPLLSVSKLSQAERDRLKPLVERAASRATGDSRAQLDRLLATVTTGAAGAPQAQDLTTTSGGPSLGGAVKPAVNGSYPADALVLLPEKLNRNEVGDLLVAGKYQDAIDRAQGLMRSRATSEHLFQLAIARLKLAEQSGKSEAYKDAGLDFMRVVIYFPLSPYAAPALLETAYVHDKLGLSEKAEELYEQAGRALNPDDDARYHARYEQLTGKAGSAPSPAP